MVTAQRSNPTVAPMNETLVTTNTSPTVTDIEKVAELISGSRMGGIQNAAQAVVLMAYCLEDNQNIHTPLQMLAAVGKAMRIYHVIENRLSMRADAMLGEFQNKGGSTMFHVRTDEMVAATFFADKQKVDDKARQRGIQRFDLLWSLDSEKDPTERGKIMVEISKLSHDGEETVIRTLADCIEKGIAAGRDGNLKTNWRQSPRQMLTARVITEGVRLMNPALIAGLYSEEETRDIVQQERETEYTITRNPRKSDRAALEAIIEEHEYKARTTINEQARKHYQGLAAEARVALADLDVPPQPPAEAPKTPTAPPERTHAYVEEQPTPQETAPEPAEASDPVKNWQEVICHIGAVGGNIHGKKLGTLFAPERSEKSIKSMQAYFAKAIGSSPIAKDKALWNGVKTAAEAWTVAQQQPKAEETKPEPTAALAEKTTANPTAWQDFVIESKSPRWNGRKLGDFSPAELGELDRDYTAKVDWTKATPKQKKLRAMLALALAEATPAPATTPDVLEAHTHKLIDACTRSQIPHQRLIEVAKKASWITGEPEKLSDIPPAEAETLLSDWASVEAMCE